MSLITNAPVTWLPLWQYSFHFLLAKHFQPSLTIAYLQSLLPIIQIDIPWHWPWEYKSGQHTLDFWSQAGPALLHGHQQPVACCNRWTDPSHYFGHSTPVTSAVASTSTVALVVLQTSSLLHNNMHLYGWVYALHIAVQVNYSFNISFPSVPQWTPPWV